MISALELAPERLGRAPQLLPLFGGPAVRDEAHGYRGKDGQQQDVKVDGLVALGRQTRRGAPTHFSTGEKTYNGSINMDNDTLPLKPITHYLHNNNIQYQYSDLLALPEKFE